MAETSEVTVSHAPRHSSFFPSPESVERQLQRQFRECELTAKPEPLSPTLQREQANARLINWGAYRRREDHTIDVWTGQVSTNPLHNAIRNHPSYEPPPPPREIDIEDAVIVERYVKGLTKKNKEIAEYVYEKQYGRGLVAKMTNLTEDAVKSRIKTMKKNLK